MELQQQYLDYLGIDVWRERGSELVTTPNTGTDALLDFESLRGQVANCQACELHHSRTQTVFGVGNPNADLLIVGEAPGKQEDLQGEPFVGRAGKLLDAMLASIGLDRSSVYIANILKCRPPQNRDPEPIEVETCTPFLTQQIELMQPKLILAVGRFAAHFLLGSEDSLARLRGKPWQYGPLETPLFVSYHPAYLLRNPRDKGKSYADLLQIKSLLSQV